MASATLMGPSPARPGGARRRHTRPEVPAPSRVTARRRRKTATGGVADLLTRWADTGYWRGTGEFLDFYAKRPKPQPLRGDPQASCSPTWATPALVTKCLGRWGTGADNGV